MTFPGIFGHDRITARLSQAAARGTPHHAYLFHGPDGVGRRQVALGFAMALNCEAPTTPGVPCGACASCRRIGEGTDGDVWTVAPLPPPKNPRGKLAIRVDVVRELQSRLAFRVDEGRTRLVVVDDSELMGVEASNCLLKSLEEPPPRTVLILITRRLGQVLPTIRSRCLQIGFQRLDRDTLQRLLVERTDLEPADAERVATVAGGSLGRALTLTPDEVEAETELLRRTFAALQGPAVGRIELAAELDRLEVEARRAQGSFMRSFVISLGDVLRDAAALASGADVPARRPDCKNLAGELAGRLDADALLRLFDDLQQARGRLDRNIATRLVFEALLLENR